HLPRGWISVVNTRPIGPLGSHIDLPPIRAGRGRAWKLARRYALISAEIAFLIKAKKGQPGCGWRTGGRDATALDILRDVEHVLRSIEREAARRVGDGRRVEPSRSGALRQLPVRTRFYSGDLV